MKKLVSALLVSVLTVAMIVPVVASSSVTTSAKAGEAVATQVAEDGSFICYQTEGTPQGINNAYLANMAASTTIAGVATEAISANESKALYDAAKAALGKNCYMITAFKAVAAGPVRVENSALKAGTNVTVMVKTAAGVVAVPAIVVDGAISFVMPEGAMSVAVFYNAVAPW